MLHTFTYLVFIYAQKMFCCKPICVSLCSINFSSLINKCKRQTFIMYRGIECRKLTNWNFHVCDLLRSPQFWVWGSCCLVFSFLCCVFCTIICLFVFLFVAMASSVYFQSMSLTVPPVSFVPHLCDCHTSER